MANHKFSKRLSSFLKLKKYRKIGLRGLQGPTRRILSRTPKYNGLKLRHYVASKTMRRAYMLHTPAAKQQFGEAAGGEAARWGKLHVTEKKGGVSSYLFAVICRFPRKYSYKFLNRNTYRRYYTMPLRLSMSRFVSFLTFRGYYGRDCARLLFKKRQRREAAKRVICSAEERLDSSVQRLVRFKSLFTTKISYAGYARTHRVKSPWSIFPTLRARQLVRHGHIHINGETGLRPARFGNIRLGTCDLLHFCRLKKTAVKLTPLPPLLGKLETATGFSKLFYMVYRNMYLVSREITARGPEGSGTRGRRSSNNVERDVMRMFGQIESDHSSYLLWPVFSLLKVSDFAKDIRPLLGTTGAGAMKEDRRNRRSRLRFMRWKRLQSGAKALPGQALAIVEQDPSLMYSRFTRCYASTVYGTRRCEWVQLQQRGGRRGSSFCEALPHKTNFLEAELEYFQLLIRHYHH